MEGFLAIKENEKRWENRTIFIVYFLKVKMMLALKKGRDSLSWRFRKRSANVEIRERYIYTELIRASFTSQGWLFEASFP